MRDGKRSTVDERTTGPAVEAVALHLVGAAIVLIGTFMPWIRSGRRRRSSYDILDVAERLGISPHGVIGWGVRLWPLLPLLVVTSVVAHLVGLRRTAVAIAVVAAVHVGAVAVTVRRAPRSVLIGVEAGTWVALAGALVLLAAAAVIARRPGVRARSAARSADRS